MPCLLDGVVCSDHGTCLNGGCICEDGFSGTTLKTLARTVSCRAAVDSIPPAAPTGTICQTRLTNGTSSDELTLAIAVGVAVPLGLLLLCCLLALWLVTVWLIRRQLRRQSGNADWIIPYSELEMGETIAVGGYGEVRKAEWKGSQVSSRRSSYARVGPRQLTLSWTASQVAVKVLAHQAVSKQIQDSFEEEVQLMMNLRHPVRLHPHTLAAPTIQHSRQTLRVRAF
jgi:hypothetical protein